MTEDDKTADVFAYISVEDVSDPGDKTKRLLGKIRKCNLTKSKLSTAVILKETFEELASAYEAKALHPGDVKPALAKALNKILQPVRDHFANNANAKNLLKRVKEACINFKDLCNKKNEDRLWVDEIAAMQAMVQPKLAFMGSSRIICKKWSSNLVPKISFMGSRIHTFVVFVSLLTCLMILLHHLRQSSSSIHHRRFEAQEATSNWFNIIN